MGRGWLASRPSHLTPGKKIQYPLNKRLNGP